MKNQKWLDHTNYKILTNEKLLQTRRACLFNLHPGSRAQVLTCHFQVLPGAKQNIPHFNLLNLQEKIKKKLVCKTI